MVMATADVLAGRAAPAAQEACAGDAAALHDQLVGLVRAVGGEEDPRSSVWGEHSYARPRGPPPGAQVRVLLEARAPVAPDVLDVVSPPAPPPRAPLDALEDDDASQESPGEGEDEVEEEEDWEERLCALAPGDAHARLLRATLDILSDLRLERCAAPGAGRWARREGALRAARRLRRALAPHWGGAASWVLNVLPTRSPPALRRLLPVTLRELRRALPRLADRLPPLPAPRDDPLDAVAEPRGAEAGPWLAWAPSGCDALDERFVRRLAPLLHTRRLAHAAPPAPAPPERWCAALAQRARAALGAVLAEAGARAVLLGGAGAGAALATWLAADAAGGVRGLLLLAPPLLTAEGARDCPEDILEEVEAPLLVVVGGGGAQCWRGAAAAVAARDAGGGAASGAGSGDSSDTASACARGPRRVLLVAGADDALRLPPRARRRLALPQQALDAAVAEECARWAADVTEPAARASPAASPDVSPDARATRRVVAASGAASGAEADERRASSASGSRAIEIVEGRVISRVTGGSPLALMTPRRLERAEPAPTPPPPLAAADIMQLPIVFADDDLALEASPGPAARSASPAGDAGGAITVTSGHPRARVPQRAGGAVKYTRVIVAKRAPPTPPTLPTPPRARGPGRPPRSRPAVLRAPRALD